MSNGSLNGRRRVVITGLGAVTPLGLDVDTTWNKLLAGGSGAGPITQFDPEAFPVHFACEVKDFEPTDYIEYKQARRMDRFAHLIVGAARQAEKDSGLEIEKEAGPCRRRDRHRDRRAQGAAGLLRRPPPAGA